MLSSIINKGISATDIAKSCFLNLRTVQRWIKDFRNEKKIDRIKPPGRTPKATSIDKMRKAKTLFNKKFSGYKIAQVLNITQPSVVSIRKKLGLKAYVKRFGPLLNERQMKTRVHITRWWRKTNAKVGKFELRKKQKIWSDEKIFTLNGGLNKKNDVIYAKTRDEADLNGGFIGRKKYPLSVMVWCGLTIHGPIYYFVEKGTKINGNYYTRKILPFAKREGIKMFGDMNWVFQQDGAPAHTSKISQKWCSTNFDYFLPKDKSS